MKLRNSEQAGVICQALESRSLTYDCYTMRKRKIAKWRATRLGRTITINRWKLQSPSLMRLVSNTFRVSLFWTRMLGLLTSSLPSLGCIWHAHEGTLSSKWTIRYLQTSLSVLCFFCLPDVLLKRNQISKLHFKLQQKILKRTFFVIFLFFAKKF